MRTVFWFLFPIIVLMIFGQIVMDRFMYVSCYNGNDRACLMVSERHDISIHQRK